MTSSEDQPPLQRLLRKPLGMETLQHAVSGSRRQIAGLSFSFQRSGGIHIGFLPGHAPVA